MSNNANRRTVFLINPKFQISFLIYTVSIATLTAAIFYGAVYYFFWKFRAMGAAVGLPANHVFYQFLNEQQTSMNWCWLGVSVLSIVTLTVTGLLLSHRVAGPLFHLHRHMKRVANGESQSEVQFREKDFFPELADAYNEQLKTLLESKGGKKAA